MGMNLKRDNLLAFYEVYKHNSFTKAAKMLRLTQSALSHRIRNLERELEVTVFDREPTGIRLTDAGAKLLRFCQTQLQVEEELLRDLQEASDGGLTGTLRVGSVSSLAWSVVTPALRKLVQDNPTIQVDMIAREVSELPALFKRGRFDFLLTTERMDDVSLEEKSLGYEKYVLIEPSIASSRSHVYLDHQEEDKFTLNFLKFNKQKTEGLIRSFMDDNHGLVAGVRSGYGVAIVPDHILAGEKGIKIRKMLSSQKHAVYLYFRKQPFYSRLHKAAALELATQVPKLLGSSGSRLQRGK